MSVEIRIGDALKLLRELPDESVNCCVTSPPYFGLRDYQVDGQIGLEETPDEFVGKLVDVFRDMRRALRKDGTLWLNLGDSYAGSWGNQGRKGERGTQRPINGGMITPVGDGRHKDKGSNTGKIPAGSGLKPKDLIGIPWMVAFALRADGWWLRSANIWAKPNGMPESVRDRPSIGHEYVFQLSKSSSYYYDDQSVRLPAVPESVARLERAMKSNLGGADLVMSGGSYSPPGQSPHQGGRRAGKQRGHTRDHDGFNDRWDEMSKAEQQANGSSLKSVWWIPTKGYSDAHFATMPPELAATCILAGCPEGGTVIDPFGGAGTTGLVADRLQRNAILIELNPEYALMAKKRIHGDAPLFASVA